MTSSLATYGWLLAAIVCETLATSFLKESQQFTRLVPSLITAAAYAGAFYFLSIVLKDMPVGVAYAIWSGLGIILVSLIGLVVFKQHLSFTVCVGLGLIIAGVAVVNLANPGGH